MNEYRFIIKTQKLVQLVEISFHIQNELTSIAIALVLLKIRTQDEDDFLSLVEMKFVQIMLVVEKGNFALTPVK